MLSLFINAKTPKSFAPVSKFSDRKLARSPEMNSTTSEKDMDFQKDIT